MGWLDAVLAQDRVPDALLRIGIRRLVRQRLAAETRGGPSAIAERKAGLVAMLRQSPIAISTDAANEQHYEVPADFFEWVLGPRRKYSSALWPEGVDSLEAAEVAMLERYTSRAELADGQRILELGCGWGSLTIFMAESFPTAQIVAVSNSASQRRHIEEALARRGLENVEVITCDMNEFDTHQRFDRVVSIEMFEHMRNYGLLFQRIAGWLEPGGKLFVHIFGHRSVAYPFEAKSAGDWMSRYFFTGGLMPSANLLLEFQDPLAPEQQWAVNGRNYARTAEAWLSNMDRHRAEIDPILAETYGTQNVRRWRAYWRIFFMACAELFGHANGQEWMVYHYRWRKPEQL